jgi:alkylation response protein AidB-like acyl-CoA dehydrogenase
MAGAARLAFGFRRHFAGDLCNEVCHAAVEIFGGYGLMNEYPVQRYLRDSYFPKVGGGTSDIIRLVVARQLGF